MNRLKRGLQHIIANHPPCNLRLSQGRMVGKFGYGLGLKRNSPYTNPISGIIVWTILRLYWSDQSVTWPLWPFPVKTFTLKTQSFIPVSAWISIKWISLRLFPGWGSMVHPTQDSVTRFREKVTPTQHRNTADRFVLSSNAIKLEY